MGVTKKSKTSSKPQILNQTTGKSFNDIISIIANDSTTSPSGDECQQRCIPPSKDTEGHTETEHEVTECNEHSTKDIFEPKEVADVQSNDKDEDYHKVRHLQEIISIMSFF